MNTKRPFPSTIWDMLMICAMAGGAIVAFVINELLFGG